MSGGVDATRATATNEPDGDRIQLEVVLRVFVRFEVTGSLTAAAIFLTLMLLSRLHAEMILPWTKPGKIHRDFELGEYDITDEFAISEVYVLRVPTLATLAPEHGLNCPTVIKSTSSGQSREYPAPVVVGGQCCHQP